MTDHLEPYRRMVRSIRFVPPLGRTHLSDHHQLMKPVVPPLLEVKLSPIVKPTLEPVVDPSEHVSALVREAVSKPTVLPVSYAIPENIGDRISRLAVSKPKAWAIILPKIPQPDPNWTPTTVEHPIEADVEEQVEETAATVTAEPVEVEEAAETPLEVEAETTPTTEPVLVEEISNEALQVEALTPSAEEISQVEATTASAESIAVEETPEETSEVEAETSTAELVPEELPNVEAETSTAEETSEVEAETSTAELVPEELPNVEAETSTAEETSEVEAQASIAEPEEEAQQPTFLEKVSNQIEAVTDSIKKAAQDFVELVAPEEPSPAETQSEPDAAVELIPSAEQESSESETNQIICPKCESTEVRKNGHYKGKQRYACKDCSKSFVLADSAQNSTEKTPEANGSQLSDSVPTKSQKAAKAKTNKKAKGFGRSKG